MNGLKNKVRNIKHKSHQGFTMLELILVIIIMGIMAVGISGFITLSTQTYLNATNRDELIGNARFVIERLSRELRNALPNSIRIKTFGTRQCIQFTPIDASTIYTDIPVLPELASKELSVIPFKDDITDTSYLFKSGDLVTVYPLKAGDIYADSSGVLGKTFQVDTVNSLTPGVIELINGSGVNFEEDSPTQRLYITNQQVSYCYNYVISANVGTLVRFSDAITSGSQTYPTSTHSYMAGYLTSDQPFNYQPATLQRNAVVQIHFKFTKEDENYVFDHEVHINNVP